MTAPFPHHYHSTIVRSARSRAAVQAPPRITLRGGPPPEFGGEPELWSPEHLLLSAIGLCLETTFDALAARHDLPIARWSARVDGDVDRTATGLAFTSFTVNVEIVVDAAHVEHARALLERAKHHCLITAALKVPVDVIGVVTATPSTPGVEWGDEVD